MSRSDEERDQAIAKLAHETTRLMLLVGRLSGDLQVDLERDIQERAAELVKIFEQFSQEKP